MNFNESSDDIADRQWGASLNLGYTGRENFYIGLESVFGRVKLLPLDDSELDNLDSLVWRLNFMYYF